MFLSLQVPMPETIQPSPERVYFSPTLAVDSNCVLLDGFDEALAVGFDCALLEGFDEALLVGFDCALLVGLD